MISILFEMCVYVKNHYWQWLQLVVVDALGLDHPLQSVVDEPDDVLRGAVGDLLAVAVVAARVELDRRVSADALARAEAAEPVAVDLGCQQEVPQVERDVVERRGEVLAVAAPCLNDN